SPPAEPRRQQQLAVVAPPRPAPSRPAASGPYAAFRDCAQCPEMVPLPGGSFTMGSADDPSERPTRQVSVQRFDIGRFPVTVGEWRECLAAKACTYAPLAEADAEAPVSNVSWNDAQQYVGWLAKLTQRKYRLPSEAEWEYAARARTATKFWWGVQPALGM